MSLTRNFDCICLYKNNTGEITEDDIMSEAKNCIDSIEVPPYDKEQLSYEQYMEQLQEIVQNIMNWTLSNR
jgi:hypothetical protein